MCTPWGMGEGVDTFMDGRTTDAGSGAAKDGGGMD